MARSKRLPTLKLTPKISTNNFNMSVVNPKKSFYGVIVFCLAVFSQVGSSQAKDILIFSAASLALPLQEIADIYSKNTPDRVRISFAASSTLARQLSKGAPADIYISANQKWMDYLAKRVPIIASSKREIFSNALVLVAPVNSSQHTSQLSAQSFKALLKDGRLAIGDPNHVPVGTYGKQALKTLNLWESAKGRLAPLTNARAVLSFVERGETPAGIVYLSDTFANEKVAIIFTFPPSSHDRISYWMARTRSANGPAAMRFFNILQAKAAKVVFKRYGFLVE
jgi:molybdate transport system substrate-binding protein